MSQHSKTNVLFALGLPVLQFFNMMYFKVLIQEFIRSLIMFSWEWVISDIHCVCGEAGVSWEGLQTLFKVQILWWIRGSKARGYSPSCLTLYTCRSLVSLQLQSNQSLITASAEVCEEMAKRIRGGSFTTPLLEVTMSLTLVVKMSIIALTPLFVTAQP